MPTPLITAHNLKISQPNKVIINNAEFSINRFDRIILVGKNGCGKSSLLKALKRTDEIDGGTIWLSPNLKLFYLEQDPPVPSINNLLDFFTKDIEFPDMSKINDIIEQLNLNNIDYRKRL